MPGLISLMGMRYILRYFKTVLLAEKAVQLATALADHFSSAHFREVRKIPEIVST
jgi:hypothetical protein